MRDDAGIRIWAPAGGMLAGLFVFGMMVFAATRADHTQPGQTAQSQQQQQRAPENAAPAGNNAAAPQRETTGSGSPQR